MNRPEKLTADLSQFVPAELAERVLTQQLIPTIAKDERQIRAIEQAIHEIPTEQA